MSSYHRGRWIVILVSGIVSAALIVGWIGYRYVLYTNTQQQQNRHAATLCEVIRGLVIKGDKALDTITYYKRHPAELAAQHHENAEALRKLDCNQLK